MERSPLDSVKSLVKKEFLIQEMNEYENKEENFNFIGKA